jgi:hypothetical protein
MCFKWSADKAVSFISYEVHFCCGIYCTPSNTKCPVRIGGSFILGEVRPHGRFFHDEDFVVYLAGQLTTYAINY